MEFSEKLNKEIESILKEIRFINARLDIIFPNLTYLESRIEELEKKNDSESIADIKNTKIQEGLTELQTKKIRIPETHAELRQMLDPLM